MSDPVKHAAVMNVLDACAWLKVYRQNEGDHEHTSDDDAEAKRVTEFLRARLKNWCRRVYQDPGSDVYDQIVRSLVMCTLSAYGVRP